MGQKIKRIYAGNLGALAKAMNSLSLLNLGLGLGLRSFKGRHILGLCFRSYVTINMYSRVLNFFVSQVFVLKRGPMTTYFCTRLQHWLQHSKVRRFGLSKCGGSNLPPQRRVRGNRHYTALQESVGRGKAFVISSQYCHFSLYHKWNLSRQLA